MTTASPATDTTTARTLALLGLAYFSARPAPVPAAPLPAAPRETALDQMFAYFG